jgi:hypothetical protein
MKPTPAPWIVDGYNVRQPSGRFIAYTGPQHTPRHLYPPACKAEDEANAEFIVRAANSHDALVEALQGVLDAFPDLPDFEDADGQSLAPLHKRIISALALATGKESA